MRNWMLAFGPVRAQASRIAMVVVALMLVTSATLFVVTAPEDVERVTGQNPALLAVDSDDDGLPDALETRIGSRLDLASTLGDDVPDGWLHLWFGDRVRWDDPGFLAESAWVAPPGALPSAIRSVITYPTIAQAYHVAAAANATHQDPRHWDQDGDGIADAWLWQHGLAPWATGPDTVIVAGDLQVAQKYARALDPTRPDSDGDGLTDKEELEGRLGPTTFTPTDPGRYATHGGGVADGYLVRFGLPPDADPHAAPAGDGLTVLQAFTATMDFCADACQPSSFIRSGPVIDPTTWDTSGDGIPDAWILAKTGFNPAEPVATRPWQSTAAWDEVLAGPGPGLVIDVLNPRPLAQNVSYGDAYAFARPGAYNEAVSGPWWGGIDPGTVAPEGALPAAVALRGWQVAQYGCRGCNASAPGAPLVATVDSDPRLADTDNDGLTDLAEYLGALRGGAALRTDPRNRDTDHDGLADNVEVDGLTDPLRADTSGSFLHDGEEKAYWDARAVQAKQKMAAGDADAIAWLAALGAHDAAAIDAMLSSGGSLRGGLANLLEPDADGDGIRNGAELFPNRYLEAPGSHPRPATDPARADTDADGLPDAWEIRWSRDLYYDCSSSCVPPPGARDTAGWPLDPADPDAFMTGAGTDASLDLSGDSLLDQGITRSFSSGLAYKFDLHPFERDTDGDGLSDMFELYWGWLGIDDATLQQLRQRIGDGDASIAWARDAGASLAARMPDSFSDVPDVAFFHPGNADQVVSAQKDLLSHVGVRAKGTWVMDGAPCGTQQLPGSEAPLRSEAAMAGMVDRVGLAAPCWTWIAYPVQDDARFMTNPWRHDSDVDGLPDAWESYYGGTQGFQPNTPLASAIAAGCQDPALGAGLGDDLCITAAIAYARGLDPRRGDTDGGGLPDWLELAIEGLDPLQPLDDRGEEDWDSDGLLNRVEAALGTSPLDPDSDNDGLLDGDSVGIEQADFLRFDQGDGGLCMRGGPDPVPRLEHRPKMAAYGDSTGPVNYTAAIEALLAQGLVHDAAPGTRCPLPVEIDGVSYPYTRFEREAAYDAWANPPRALGARTDSTRWDTSGDGVPDGWLVYWRARGPNDEARGALDPTSAAAGAGNPDGDLPTLKEYLRGRPVGWSEPRDGPWWGGSDPGRIDSDGDLDWFASRFSGGDVLDTDIDNDGLEVGLDPYPGMDGHNVGLVAWNQTTQRFDTTYAAMWQQLALRGVDGGRDSDEDGVPDFLDRARVVVQADGLLMDGGPVTQLAKSESRLMRVAGTVRLAEDPQQVVYQGQGGTQRGAAGIGGATVKLVFNDGVSDVTVGAAVSDAAGRFVVEASMTDPPAFAPPDAFVEGTRATAASPVSFAGAGGRLNAGQVTWRIVVEPNPSGLQPVTFDGHGDALAFKDIGGPAAKRFTIPTTSGAPGPAMAAAMRNASGQPDPDIAHVQHPTSDIFAGVSPATTIALRADTALQLTLAGPHVLRGDILELQGRLTDEAGKPLEDRAVVFQLWSDDALVGVLGEGRTAPDGIARAPWTVDQTVGTYTIVATARLNPGDVYLSPPGNASAPVAVGDALSWGPHVLVNQDQFLAGSSVALPAFEPATVAVTLSEAITGRPVVGRDVTLTLKAPEGGLLARHDAHTDSTGRALWDLPGMPAGIRPASIRLEFEAARLSPADAVVPQSIFVRPILPTRLVAEPTQGVMHETQAIGGTLLYFDGLVERPAVGALGVVTYNGPSGQGEVPVGSAEAAFAWFWTGERPGNASWQAQYRADPGGYYADAAPVTWNTSVLGTQVITVASPNATRDKEVPVEGTLTLGDGRLWSGPVHARWSDGAWQQGSASNGAWRIALPARAETGRAVVEVQALASPFLAGAQASATTSVRATTVLEFADSAVTVGVDGVARHNATANIRDDRGSPLAGHRATLLVDPDGLGLQEELLSDAEGRFVLPFGPWVHGLRGDVTVVLSIPEGAHTHAATKTATLAIHHEYKIHIDRIPAQARAGGQIHVSGHIEGPSPWGRLLVQHPPGPDTSVSVAGATWQVLLDVPAGAKGVHDILVLAEPEDHATFESDAVSVPIVSNVTLTMHVVHNVDGSRTATIKGAPAGTTVVVVRQIDGHAGQLYPVTMDNAGQGVLALTSAETGTLAIGYIDDPLLQVSGATLSTARAPGLDSADAVPWIAGAAAAAVLLGGAMWTVLWRHSRRQGIQQIAAQAARDLIDPNADPRSVIKQAYTAVLALLGRRGYVPAQFDTVREILDASAQVLQLPRQPMAALSGLFERATYSSGPVTASDRRIAIASFSALSHGGPP